jgi:poly-gamma-glutamate capsule biosynthesis protein CapA/YwtB (metallophosphatase superfamily)
MKQKVLIMSWMAIISGCQVISTAYKPSVRMSEDFSLTSFTNPIHTITSGPTAESYDGSTPQPTFALPTNTISASATVEGLPVQLAIVGDIMLGRSLAEIIQQGEGNRIFSSVVNVLSNADLTMGNLECAMGEGGKPASKAYTFLAPPQAANILKDAGFDLVSLANNHAMDFGKDVFLQTLDLLQTNEIQYVGAGINAEEAYSARIYSIHGIRLAILAYASVPIEYLGFDTRNWAANTSTPGIAWGDDEIIQETIQKNKIDADFIIVLFHFGNEGLEIPTEEQIRLAHMAIDHGANIVIGSHPHILQKVEAYNNGIIFYSLGNFVFDEFSGKYNESIILQITLDSKLGISYFSVPVNIIDGIPTISE